MLTRQIGRLFPLVLLMTLGILASLPDRTPVWTVAAQDLDCNFMILGVSSDDDENEWREFTVKNKMVWP